MANQTTDPATAGRDEIVFEVERLARNEPGLLEVRGRWFGVRGRRFVRPTLTLVVDGSEQRWLADLEHKPWAAEDGEDWLATFPIDPDVDTSNLELSVAPDITVKLGDGRPSAVKRRRMRSSAAILRAPRVRSDAAPHGPTLSERAQEIERLNAKLEAAGQELEQERARRTGASREVERARGRAAQDVERERARVTAANEELERERERRAAVARELEDERTQGLRLRSRVGQLQADLDLARAAQLDMDSISADLGAARLALTEERAQTERSSSEAEDSRRALAIKLEEAQRAVAQEQARAESISADLDQAHRELDVEREQTQRLSTQLTQARAAAAAPETQEFRAVVERPTRPARRAEAKPPPAETVRARRDPPRADSAVRRDPPRADSTARRDPPRAESAARRDPPRAESAARRDPARHEPGRSDPLRLDTPRPDRPLNPSLRHRTYWAGRVIALLFILAVIAAVIIVLKSTVLPHIV
jgi:hypothetical protein